jgi:sigma-B regulation protein RsbU (phosphoserine phosphatase)
MKIMSVRMRNLMEEEIQRQRLEEELAIGRQIQLSLLPDRCPDIPGWEITAVYRAARQIGGDLYDFILPPDDPQTLNLVIADVTGKGVPAALFMAFSRTIIRAEAAHGLGPAATLMRANQFIYRDVHSQLFLTAFYASLDTQTGRMVFANGGHDWPLLLRASTHEIRVLKTPGLILGAFPEVSLEEAEITVAPGDALIFYTDGVTEARNADDQFFGEERLEAVLAAHRGDGAEVLLQSVVTAVAQFVGSTPQSDDLTLVVVKRQAL